MPQQILNTPRETTHQRIAAALEAIEQNMSDEHEAVNIDYDNTNSDLSADNVQEAIDELSSEKANTADLGTAASKDVPTSGNATATQVVMGNDSRLSDSRPASDVSTWAKASTKPTYTASEVGAYTKTESDNKYVAKETGKGLSTNDYTTADKNKLAGIEAQANKTVVDSFMSDSSTNPLQNKVITKELEGTKTTTGNPLTVTDCAPVNAVNLSIDLEPVQDLHGYDHPWVGGAGKNKCPAYTSTETQYGVTIAGNSEGEISVNGTLDGTNLYGFILNSSISLGAGTYTLNGANPNGARLVLYDSNDNTLADTQDANPTFTLESTTTAVLRIFVYANVQYDEVVRPMIRLSTETDSTFAPYTNICPISGRSEVAIQRVGVNLYPITVGEDYWDNNAGGTHSNNNGELVITVNNNNYSGVYSSGTNNILRKTCLALSNFTISADVKASVNMNVKLSNVEVQLTTSYQRLTFGTSTMISIYGTGTAGTIYVKNLQLELGSTATTYEPYASKTYTIQIGQTVYGGQLDVTKGELVVDRGYVDLGDLNYTYESSWGASSDFYSHDLQSIIKTPTGDGIVAKAVCSSYKIVSRNTMYNSSESALAILMSGIMKIRDSRYTDATTFKTAVTGQTLVYELATPYTIDLTPQQIKLLENTNTLYTDYEGDTITIEYQPNNAIGEAVRVVEESYDPEFAVRPVLKKRAFSGTTDTDGSVTLINASDIPSGHKIIPLQITDMTIDGSAGTYFVEYKPYNSGDAVKGYCYFYMSGSQMFPVGKAITGNFYYYDLEG